jgi:tetratricopeptide (TPR) repeat protein
LLLIALVGGCFYFLDPWNWRSKAPDQGIAYHWQEAQRANEEREFDEAKEHLKHVLEASPFSAGPHFLMARVSRRSLEFRTWRRHLFQAARLGWPRDQIEFEFQLQQAQMGDVWPIEPVLLEALQTHPESDAELIFEALAEGYLQNHSVDKIMQITAQWLELSPEAWLPHYYRGQAQYLEGTRAKAIEEYQTVLKLNPEHSLAKVWLAGVLAEDGQFKEGLALYESYLQDNPGEPNGVFGVAKCQYSLGQTEAARKTLKQLRESAPAIPKVLLLQAKVDMDDNPAEALKWLRQANQLSPKESEIIHSIVTVLRRLNQNEEADKYTRLRDEVLKLHGQMIDLRKELRKRPFDVDLRYEIGRVDMLLGKDSDAADWFETVLRLDPQHAKTLQAMEELNKRAKETTRPLN